MFLSFIGFTHLPYLVSHTHCCVLVDVHSLLLIGTDDPYPCPFLTSNLRRDNYHKYGVLPAYKTDRGETVRKYREWCLIIQIIAAFLRTTAAITTLALAFILHPLITQESHLSSQT
jgi:hypothetical protein